MKIFFGIVFVTALCCVHGLPSLSGPVRDSSSSDDAIADPAEVGAPAPPPRDYRPARIMTPPMPEESKIPAGHLTSAQINQLFDEDNNNNDDDRIGKTVDQIILQNTQDLSGSSTREGDVVATGEEKFTESRKKRATNDDDYYDDDDKFEKPEAPGLSVNEIDEMPPIADIPARRRSPDGSIDAVISSAGFQMDESQGRPAASAVLFGRAKARMPDDLLVDMDMLLTKDQFDSLYGKAKRKKRAGIKAQRYRWKKAVLPYQFLANQGFNDKDKNEIYKAMRNWQERTCIRFEPYTDALARTLGHKNRLVFQNGGGCSSYVGVINNGGQPVTLAQGCRWKSVVVHELGHAIGLHHEQTRPDRDSYVTINLNNVHAGMRYNFDKYDTNYVDSRGIAYDYRSIMHYGETAFSSNGQKTIIAKDSRFQKVIGNAQELSDTDAQLVKLMYNCPSGPTTTTTTTTRPPITTCEDKAKYCAYWKQYDQCEENPSYMSRFCTKTCGKCKGTVCKDENQYCNAWAKKGYCSGSYEEFMQSRCAKSCGTCGSAYNDFADLWGTNMPTDAASQHVVNFAVVVVAAVASAVWMI